MQKCSESQGKKIIYLKDCSKVPVGIGRNSTTSEGSPVDSFATLVLRFHQNTGNSLYCGILLAVCGALQYIKIALLN